jgi:hypothetical protein
MSALMLTLIDRKGEITGTFQEADLDGSQVTHANVGVMGTRSGSDLSLELQGRSQTLTARRDRSQLHLSYPDPNTGVIQTTDLRKASTDAYNEALAGLRNRAAQQQRLVEAEQQLSASAAADAQSAKRMAAAVDALQSVAFRDFFAHVWEFYDRAMTTLRRAAAAVDAAVDDGTECGDVQSHVGDVESARGDVSSAHGDFESADSDAGRAAEDGQNAIDAALAASGDRTSGFDALVSQARVVLKRLSDARSDAAGRAGNYDHTADGIVARAKSRADTRC